VREYDAGSLRLACERVFPSVRLLLVHGSFRAGGGGLGLERWLAFRAFRRLARPLLPPPLYRAPLSLADFSIEVGGARRALDLLAVCAHR
jgi:hypothetical protein